MPGAVQVQIHDRAKAIRRNFHRGGLELPARIIDEDVGQPVPLDDRLEKRVDFDFVADVDRVRVGFDPLCVQRDDRFPEPFEIARSDDDPGTEASKFARRRKPDPGTAPGNEREFPVKQVWRKYGLFVQGFALEQQENKARYCIIADRISTWEEGAMGSRANIERLLNPQKIAFIGGRDLAIPIEAARTIGYGGEIWVVNPKYPEIGGVATVASIAELPGTPDAAYLAVRAELTVELVAELRASGCAGAVCFAAGFAESGRRELQDRLREAAGEMAVVGPNCYGILNYLDRSALWADFHGGRPVDRGAAIISQSGNLSLILTMADRALPLSHLISNGNQAVLEASDFIDVLVDDPRVSAIGLYIEGLRDVAKFWRAAVRALRIGKPIIALKSGVSEIGSQMTLHHTGSSAGDDAFYRAMFDRLGVVRVRSLPEMLETLKMFCTSGSLPGKRLGVLTCSGADSAMTADRASELGFELPPLSPAQQANLRKYIADFVNLTNPFDFNTQIWGKPEFAVRCFEDMLGDEQYDVVALIHDFPAPQFSDLSGWESIGNSFIAARRKVGKPAVMISNFGKTIPEKMAERLCENGVTPLGSIQDGLAAVRHAAWYGMRRPRLVEADDLEEPMQADAK